MVTGGPSAGPPQRHDGGHPLRERRLVLAGRGEHGADRIVV